MAHIIAEPCIGTKDTACVAVCPVDCIHPDKPTSPPPRSYIDNDTCIDCGLCVDECRSRRLPQETCRRVEPISSRRTPRTLK